MSILKCTLCAIDKQNKFDRQACINHRLYAFTDISIKMYETSHMLNWHNWENAKKFQISQYSKFISHLKRQLEWEDQISSDFLDGIHCLSFFS